MQREAPERVYLDGDAEAGNGMFPRCFENPKYASEPAVEYVRADLYAALMAERDTARKYQAAYAEMDRIATAALRKAEAERDAAFAAGHAAGQDDMRERAADEAFRNHEDGRWTLSGKIRALPIKPRP